jgi:hypothetical protein
MLLVRSKKMYKIYAHSKFPSTTAFNITVQSSEALVLTLYPSIFQRSDTGGGHVNRTLDVPTSLIINLDMKPGSERLEYSLKLISKPRLIELYLFFLCFGVAIVVYFKAMIE